MKENIGNLRNNHIKKNFMECESISADELIDTHFPPQKWLVENFIPAGALTVIFFTFTRLNIKHIVIGS